MKLIRDCAAPPNCTAAFKPYADRRYKQWMVITCVE